MKQKQQFKVCKTADIPEGGRKLVEAGGKEIGVFNVGGEFFALLNYCPHSGGALCKGPVTGTALPTDDFTFVYGRQNELVRCAWHGWEFEIKTGQLLIDPKIRAKRYEVTVDDGDVVVHI